MDQVKAINSMLDSLSRGADAIERVAGLLDGGWATPDVTAVANALLIRMEYLICPECHEFLDGGGEHAEHCSHAEIERVLKETLGK